MLYLAAHFSFLHENKVFSITQLCQSEIADKDTGSRSFVDDGVYRYGSFSSIYNGANTPAGGAAATWLFD